jgi:hypothetical protein
LVLQQGFGGRCQWWSLSSAHSHHSLTPLEVQDKGTPNMTTLLCISKLLTMLCHLERLLSNEWDHRSNDAISAVILKHWMICDRQWMTNQKECRCGHSTVGNQSSVHHMCTCLHHLMFLCKIIKWEINFVTEREAMPRKSHTTLERISDWHVKELRCNN